MERPFEKEAFDAFQGMDGDKALGPDTLWLFSSIVGSFRRYFAGFSKVLNYYKFEKSLNTTFVPLIPKKSCQHQGFSPYLLGRECL